MVVFSGFKVQNMMLSSDSNCPDPSIPVSGLQENSEVAVDAEKNK